MITMTTSTSSADLDSRRLLSAWRALTSLSAGLTTGAIVALLATPQLLPLVSWTVTVAVLLTWAWRKGWPQDSDGTKRLAEQEGTSRSTDVWLLAAAVVSLAVVVVALVQSSNQRTATDVASVLLSVLSVALSWALVNTVYAFKYARLYYFDEPHSGGIDFKQEAAAPTYADFAYLALTVGISFAVSDTEPTATRQKGRPWPRPALLRVRHRSPGGGHQLGHQSRSVTYTHERSIYIRAGRSCTDAGFAPTRRRKA